MDKSEYNNFLDSLKSIREKLSDPEFLDAQGIDVQRTMTCFGEEKKVKFFIGDVEYNLDFIKVEISFPDLDTEEEYRIPIEEFYD